MTRMTCLKSRSHIGKSKSFYGGVKLKGIKKILKEYLVMWRGFPISEASWITQDQLINPKLLKQFIDEDQPEEEKV